MPSVLADAEGCRETAPLAKGIDFRHRKKVAVARVGSDDDMDRSAFRYQIDK